MAFVSLQLEARAQAIQQEKSGRKQNGKIDRKEKLEKTFLCNFTWRKR